MRVLSRLFALIAHVLRREWQAFGFVKSTYKGDRYKVVQRLRRAKRDVLATTPEMLVRNRTLRAVAPF